MRIYHGSKEKIVNPLVKGSDPHDDYGPSFYLTFTLNDAKMWACKNDAIGFVNEYEIDSRSFHNLKILDLTDKTKFSVLNWIAILMHFRSLKSSFIKRYEQNLKWLEKYYIDVNEFDIVKGYRADDSYFQFPLQFISNNLSLEDLETIFKLGKLGIQYGFISERSIKLLHFVNCLECETTFLGQHYLRVKEATNDFNESISKPIDLNKTYILDLMRKENE